MPFRVRHPIAAMAVERMCGFFKNLRSRFPGMRKMFVCVIKEGAIPCVAHAFIVGCFKWARPHHRCDRDQGLKTIHLELE